MSDQQVCRVDRSLFHRLLGHPIAPSFNAPKRESRLRFGLRALAAAVARTATIRGNAPIGVLDAPRPSTLPMLETMVEDDPTFGFSPNLQCLANTDRTFFAAPVGAGITDPCMNALGYAWRAGTVCLSKALSPFTGIDPDLSDCCVPYSPPKSFLQSRDPRWKPRSAAWMR